MSRSPILVRLACVRPAANVRSEPGSNSPVKLMSISNRPSRADYSQYMTAEPFGQKLTPHHFTDAMFCFTLHRAAIQFSETDFLLSADVDFRLRQRGRLSTSSPPNRQLLFESFFFAASAVSLLLSVRRVQRSSSVFRSRQPFLNLLFPARNHFAERRFWADFPRKTRERPPLVPLPSAPPTSCSSAEVGQ